MCYERRSITSDEQKKTRTVADTAKRQSHEQDQVVNSLLRDAKEAGQKAQGKPAKRLFGNGGWWGFPAGSAVIQAWDVD
jgi:hypothetical protein